MTNFAPENRENEYEISYYVISNGRNDIQFRSTATNDIARMPEGRH